MLIVDCVTFVQFEFIYLLQFCILGSGREELGTEWGSIVEHIT